MHQLFAATQTAELGAHLSLAKILTALVLFVAWLFANQWVDRDAERVHTTRQVWNIVVGAGGYGGVFILLMFPWKGAAFFVGLAFWLILAAGTLVAYVVHRNGRVHSSQQVLTPRHFKRLTAGGGVKKTKVDKGIRVKLLDYESNEVEKPDEPESREQFDATQDFLFDVLWKRASDADVARNAESVRVIYKIDGVAAEQSDVLAPEDGEKVIHFLKQHAGLKIEEKRRPQIGRMLVGLLGAEGKPQLMDVHTSGTTQGERLRLRVSRSGSMMRLEELGFSEKRLAEMKKLVALDTGTVLFAGPKESGVTTTQYAALRDHDAYIQNIYTIETKPLLQLDNITQQIHKGAEEQVSFARMLQTVLRREPDVVMVSQCEDHETAQIAARAAAEKKIYVAVKASECADAIARFVALVGDPKLAAASLVGVVAQRLLRVLCPACREAYKPEESLLKKANLPIDKIEHFYRPPSDPIVDKKGREVVCQNCQSSRYNGRTGVYQVLVVSDALRKLIAAGASATQIKAQARAEKMRYLQEEGLLKVMEGVTSMAEVMRGLRADAK